MELKSVRHTPAYIYIIAFILAVPGTWLLVGTPGESVPGMISMVVLLILFGAIALGLDSLRRFLQKRDP
jgi:hypothetical protein